MSRRRFGGVLTSMGLAAVAVVAAVAFAAAPTAGAVVAAGPRSLAAVHSGVRSQAGAEVGAGGVLLVGQKLTGSEILESVGGEYQLNLLANSVDLNQFAPLVGGADNTGTTLWWSALPGAANGGSYLAMQGDGNLVLYNRLGRALWSTHTQGTGVANRLAVQGDGNLVLYSGGRAVWDTGTGPAILPAGQRMTAGHELIDRMGDPPGSSTRFVMQGDGNLVLYYGARAVWSTRTRTPGSVASMQSDGNLVVEAPNGKALWSSHTSGTGPRTWLIVNQGGTVDLFSESPLEIRWGAPYA